MVREMVFKFRADSLDNGFERPTLWCKHDDMKPGIQRWSTFFNVAMGFKFWSVRRNGRLRFVRDGAQFKDTHHRIGHECLQKIAVAWRQVVNPFTAKFLCDVLVDRLSKTVGEVWKCDIFHRAIVDLYDITSPNRIASKQLSTLGYEDQITKPRWRGSAISTNWSFYLSLMEGSQISGRIS